MAIVIGDISIEGKGVIANCDALTNDTGGTGTGDWTEQGGGSMTLTTDVFLYGTSSIAGKYASKSGFQQFDLGAGNELDFTAGTGTEDGQFIYMWVNLSTFGVLDTLANKGLAIRISSDSPGTANYIDYTIAGSDGANGWTGGWKCFVIDPTKTPSAINGTQSTIIASVRTLGVWIDTTASVRAESLFIDQIAVGNGIRIADTVGTTAISSTTGWLDIVDLCTDYVNRAWGMLQERDGIYYALGRMYIGHASQTATLSFKDSGRVIQFATSQYYESAAWKSSFDIDGAGLVIEDASGKSTTFEDGVIVGSDQGRSGTVFIGNTDQNVSLDLYGGSEATSITALYGTIFKNLSGTLVSGNDSDHVFYGVTFEGCNQFDPVGAPVIRNCSFINMWDDGVADTSLNAALLWNDNINIANCSFLANTHGTSDVAHGIEHTSTTGHAIGTITTADATGITLTDTTASFLTTATVGDIAFNETDGSTGKLTSITDNNNVVMSAGLTGGTDDQWDSSDSYSVVTPIPYTNLVFSGNEKDVLNNVGSGNGVAVSKTGTSNPATNTNPVEFIGAVPVSFEAVDSTDSAILGVQVSAYLISDNSQVILQDTLGTGFADTSYTGATPADIYYKYRKASVDPKYINLSGFATIESGTGVSVKRNMEIDTNNNA